jgi:23S rRNA (cytidine1920-2'-O)/16S rRNA (cytidine1409-2'-O)-methyltransferase
VSRGGVKLAAALDQFGFDPGGRVCLDAGASTGGFTDVLLARGARRVYAVDVGHGQLHARIATRPEVTAYEGTDIRHLPPLPEPPDFAVVDVSFIPLSLVLPAITKLVRAPADLIVLIKPQFEVGPGHAKKGVVRDLALQKAACESVTGCVAALSWTVAGILVSPIKGGDGNQEYLLGARLDCALNK